MKTINLSCSCSSPDRNASLFSSICALSFQSLSLLQSVYLQHPPNLFPHLLGILHFRDDCAAFTAKCFEFAPVATDLTFYPWRVTPKCQKRTLTWSLCGFCRAPPLKTRCINAAGCMPNLLIIIMIMDTLIK